LTLLIFDCDGVLVDSEIIAFDVLAQMLRSLGRPMSLDECRRRFMGRRTPDVLAEIEQELGHPIPPDTGARMKALLFDRLRRELQPVASVKEAIARLAWPICVASSSAPERIALSLAVTGLAPLFSDHVFSAEQVAQGKPAPDLFLFAAKTMGAAPGETIVIEDSPAGVTAARRAGMGIVGFAGASHADAELIAALRAAGADLVLTQMADLPAAVERLRTARATTAPA
jgi:HAD superfamily hydrolase (TIGR01509 family)